MDLVGPMTTWGTMLYQGKAKTYNDWINSIVEGAKLNRTVNDIGGLGDLETGSAIMDGTMDPLLDYVGFGVLAIMIIHISY